MQVSKINNNQINFKAVVRIDNLYKFSDAQNKYAADIENQMRQPQEKFYGKTAEDYYKSKGYDFAIMPAQKDCVKLKGYEESKKMAEPMFIGTYGEENRFELSHVEQRLPSEEAYRTRLSRKLFVSAYTFLLSALALTLLLTRNIANLNEEAAKKADTTEIIKNKTDSVLSDSTLKKSIFKTIKR